MQDYFEINLTRGEKFYHLHLIDGFEPLNWYELRKTSYSIRLLRYYRLPTEFVRLPNPRRLTLFEMGGMMAPKMFLTTVLKRLGGGS